GVPDDAKGYVFAAPKDADGNDVELNAGLVDRIAALAHQHGIPKATMEAFVADYIKGEMDELADREAALQAEGEKVVKSWGSDAAAKKAAIENAVRALGLNAQDMTGIRAALGAERAAAMFVKLGEGMAE